LLKLFNCLDFKPVWGLLHEPYHDSGPGRPYYSPEAIFKALLLQRFLSIPSERVLAEKLAGNRDYRRICGFRRETPSRGCFTYFRRERFREERFKEAFNFMVGQALGAVKGYILAVELNSL